MTPADDITLLPDEEIIAAYNERPKPNAYGEELLRRIHARDRAEFGMNADNPRLH